MKVKVAPTLHPSYIQRGNWPSLALLRYDLENAHAQSFTRELLRKPTRYEIDGDVTFARELLRLNDSRPLVLDIETSGVTDDAYITHCGVAREVGKVASLPWREPFKSMLRAALRDPLSVKVAHNIPFDFPRLSRALAVDIAGTWFDTLEGWHLVEPDLDNNLALLGSVVFDQSPWKGEHRDRLEVYNCKDVDATIRGYEWERARHEELELTTLMTTRVMPALRVLMAMHERGIHVDLERQQEARGQLQPILEAAQLGVDQVVAALPGRQAERERLEREAAETERAAAEADTERGKREGNKLRTVAKRLRGQALELGSCNINSPKQLVQLLYEELKFPEQRQQNSKKNKGTLTTDDDALVELARRTRHPILKFITDAREVSKLLGTYLSFEDSHVNPRLLMWAGTGRLVCRDPNMQNLPKKGGWAPLVRRIFTPREKGWVFTAFDYSQIERRLQAVMWGDERLREAFAAGRDVHRATAALLFGVPYDAVTDWQRTVSKNIVYGQSYGMGYLKFHRELAARGITMSVAEVKALLKGIEDAHPGIAAGAKATLEEVDRTRMLRNPFGRIRWFLGPAFGDALNFPFQSTTADIMLGSMIEMERQLPRGAFLVMQVHDELIVEHAPELTRQVRECGLEVMQRPQPELGGWSCPVEAKTGWDLSFADKWED